MIQYKGITQNLSNSVVGLVTHNPFSLSRCNNIFVSDNKTVLSKGFLAHITTGNSNKSSIIPQVNTDRSVFDKLLEGDCVLLDKDVMITVVWCRAQVCQ